MGGCERTPCTPPGYGPDDSTTEVCWYLYVTTVEIIILCSVWNSKSWSDLFCLLISILIDAINFRIERTATVKISVFLLRAHCSNIWCRTTSLWTHCRCRAQQRVQVVRNISKFIWRQHSTSQIEKCNLKRIEKLRNPWRVRLYSASHTWKIKNLHTM